MADDTDPTIPPAPVSIRSSASRLRDPRRFVREWVEDLGRSPRLAWRLFLRSLFQQYRQSSMGIFLIFAPVVITVLVYTFGRRSHLVATEIGGLNSTFFGVEGVLMVQSFVEAFNAMRRLFAGNHTLFRRQNLPVDGPIMAVLVDLGIRLLLRFVVLGLLMALLRVPVASTLPVAIGGFVGLSLVGAGLGLLAAGPAALAQDVNVVAGLLPLLLFTLVPVFMVPPPQSGIGRIQAANPLAWLFDGIRAAAHGGGGSITAAVFGPLVGLGLLLAGWFVCRVARPHVVERMLV